MDFIISQLIGIVVGVAAVASLQMKNVKLILLSQLICNGLGALSYILLDGFSGCGIQLIAVVQTIVYYIFRKNEKKVSVMIMAAFVCAYVLCSIFTYNDIKDIIPALAAVACAMALAQEKASRYRVFILFNGLLWLIYDIGVGAYSMLLTHGAAALSAVIGIIRLDLKAKDK